MKSEYFLSVLTLATDQFQWADTRLFVIYILHYLLFRCFSLNVGPDSPVVRAPRCGRGNVGSIPARGIFFHRMSAVAHRNCKPIDILLWHERTEITSGTPLSDWRLVTSSQRRFGLQRARYLRCVLLIQKRRSDPNRDRLITHDAAKKESSRGASNV